MEDRRQAFASQGSSSRSSSSTLMDDVMSRLEEGHENPAALLKRINSLLGLSDEASTEVGAPAPRSREHSPPRESSPLLLVPIRPSPNGSSSSFSSSGSKLKCGWFSCWSVEDAD